VNPQLRSTWPAIFQEHTGVSKNKGQATITSKKEENETVSDAYQVGHVDIKIFHGSYLRNNKPQSR
jgi:hypothetical protein